jgi:chromosome segregation protein
MAQLHGDAEGAEARAAELETRIAHLTRELEEAHEIKLEVASQGDLFTDRVATLSRVVETARSRLEGVQSAVAASREELRLARQEEMTAQDLHGSLATRQAALSRMEADREGVDPVVQAILASPRDGVLGILADFLDAKGDLSKTVESYLGIHLRALVVRDTGIAMKLAQWFREEWTGGGGLIVLPLDRVPPSEGSGGLFSQVSAKGEGAPWVRALLEGIDLDETITGTLRGRGGRVASDGSWVEAGGVLRFGNPLGTTGLLERRDRLRRLQV